jgi:Leucine-rich repeat (LRR) protein
VKEGDEEKMGASMSKIVTKAAAKQQNELDLAGRGITSLPENIGELKTCLIRLNLASNKVSVVVRRRCRPS